jgi:hypothetical protein
MVKTGRPPKTFSDEKVHELGEDLLQWVRDPEGGVGEVFYVNWYYFKHGMIRHDWHKLCERIEFRPYYEVARQIMANNLMKNKDIPQSYGGRYLAVRDDELRQEEKAIREEEAALKNKSSNDFMELADNLQKMDSFLDRLRSMQTSKSKEAEASRKESENCPESGD